MTKVEISPKYSKIIVVNVHTFLLPSVLILADRKLTCLLLVLAITVLTQCCVTGKGRGRSAKGA